MQEFSAGCWRLCKSDAVIFGDYLHVRKALPITNCVRTIHISSPCLNESSERTPRYTNVSGLKPHLRARMKHVNEIPDPTVAHNVAQLRPRYRAKLYAKHGAASGVDPGVMWPSKEELAEIKDIEAEFKPTLQELWANVAEKRESEKAARLAKEATVARSMAAMPKYIQEHKARLLKTEAEEAAALAKQKELMEEARDYYGYEIARNDPRFVLMVEMKEEEAKAAKKQKKKEDRDANVKRVLSELTRKRSRPKKSTADSADDQE
ncbi:hypothetical protein CAPTEDRAFT_226802 [Capitella teleta]|uniref:Large ribosomal subunit protein mL64 n=1 Tax=Capitella teleta TaxID=283909 RepID=N1PBC0_CAPTE|nr:hypothetical protein CAPTEDRAFT_226802 [Capitella teleta]|eukprot:ELU18930.1 hypothetical protein CAPTEDRAFT_226802 [Capitella teleta]